MSIGNDDIFVHTHMQTTESLGSVVGQALFIFTLDDQRGGSDLEREENYFGFDINTQKKASFIEAEGGKLF